MQTTTNYKLNKPDYADTADVMKINANMDTLDKKLKEHEDHINSIGLVYDSDNLAIELGGGGQSTSGGGGGGGQTSYVLTAASKEKLGGVKVGGGLSITEDGTLSVDTVEATQVEKLWTEAKNV